MTPRVVAVKRAVQSRGRVAARRFYAHRRKRADKRSVLIVGAPVPQANRGDQAMLDVAIQECRRAGFTSITVVATGPHLPRHLTPDKGLAVQDLHPFFCHDEAFRAELRLLSLLHAAAQVIIVGADILDESSGANLTRNFLRCAELAAELGVPARIVGFSVSRTPSPSLAAQFRRLGPGVRLFARDPVSRRRLQDADLTDVELSADTALLLPPAPLDDIDAGVRAFLAADARPVIGVALYDRLFTKAADPIGTVALVADALRVLAASHDVRFLLMAHGVADVEWLTRLHARLTSDDDRVACLVEGVPLAQQTKRLLGLCRHVVTSRMHVAIGALGMGVPVTSFVYRGKFEGLYEHFGLTRGLLSPATALTSASALAELLGERLDASAAEAATIAGRLPDVLKRARHNFDGLTPALFPLAAGRESAVESI